MYQIEVTSDGIVLQGDASPIVDLGKDAVPSGLHWDKVDGMLYIADSSAQGDIVAYRSDSGDKEKILSNGTACCEQVYDPTHADDNLVYSDQAARRLGMVVDGTCTYITGISTRQPKYVDGSQFCAALAQPLGVCSEGESVFLCDAAASKLKIVTPVTGMTSYLQAMYDVYMAFGIHINSEPTLPEAANILGGVVASLEQVKTVYRTSAGLDHTQLQGPHGAVASKTVDKSSDLL